MKMSWSTKAFAGCLVGLLGAAPVIAQTSNVGEFTLTANQPTATVNGMTNGVTALSDIAARDRHGRICVGFANTTPDHIMRLEQDFANVTVQVDSGGNDTTLLIQGPEDNIIRCGSDTDRRNLDAQIQDEGWSTGTYLIWVGSHNQGQRYDYSLTVNSR
jgi:hypothetical protein